MSEPRHWTVIGCGLGSLVIVLLLALGPGVVHGSWLSFSNVVGASVALVVVGAALGLIRRSTAKAVGRVPIGVGVAWLAFVGGLLALLAASGGLAGP